MDTTNLPGTQNIPVNCKNTASNTNPAASSSWGSNEYIDTFSQANSLRAFHPGPPCSSQSPDIREDNFAYQQPFFPSHPFLQPFFNSTIAPNFYFAHNFGMLSSNTSNNNIQENQKQDKCEKVNRPPGPLPENCKLQQSDKIEQKVRDSRNVQKSKDDQEGAAQFPVHQCHLQPPVDLQRNPFFIQCACNNAIPWTCNPFIVPMISYYVLWNSWRANALPSPAHPPWVQPDNTLQKECKEPACHETVDPSLNRKNCTIDSGSNTNHMYEQIKEDDYWVRKKSKSNLDNVLTETSFISLSISSLNFTEENTFCNAENNEISILMKTFSKDSDLDSRMTEKSNIEERIKNNETAVLSNNSADLLEKERGLKSGTKLISDFQPPMFIADQQECDSKIKKEQFKVKVNCASKNNSCSTLQTQITDAFFERKKSLISFKRSEKSLSKEPVIDDKVNENKSKIDDNTWSLKDKSKKSIKNFTLTEQNDSEAPKKALPKALAAAAGDLGGEACAKYRVRVPACESNSKSKLEKNKKKRISESSGLSKPGLTPKTKQKNVEKSFEVQNRSEKTAVDKTKIVRSPSHLKSGATKVDPPKESKTKISTNYIQELKKLKDKEPTVFRRKHSCIENKTKIGDSEINTKNLRPKTFLPNVREPTKAKSNSEKPTVRSKTFNTKAQSLKAETAGKKFEQKPVSSR